MEKSYDPMEWKYELMECKYDHNGMQVAIKLHFCPECPSITSAVGMRHINAEESFRSLRKPIRDNPKIFTKSEKMFLKTEKIFQIVMFFGNHR